MRHSVSLGLFLVVGIDREFFGQIDHCTDTNLVPLLFALHSPFAAVAAFALARANNALPIARG